MNILRALGIRSQTARSDERIAREKLPEINAFVDVAVGGDNRQRESVSIDEFGFGTFSTRILPRFKVGGNVDFLYTNTYGKFRFSTVCVGFNDTQAHFRMPAEVKTIASFGAKRSAVRLESMLPVQWRYAPGGEGNGEFVKGSISDLSRGGASLIVARDLKIGTQVEVRFALTASLKPVVVLSQVMRAVKIESSGKSAAGIRFLNVDSALERTINEFINERQTLRRERGVV